MINLNTRVQNQSLFFHKAQDNSGYSAKTAKDNPDIYHPSSNFVKKTIAQKVKEMGDKNFHNNQEKEAIESYKKAIEYNPDYVAPYYNLAKIYEKAENHDQAIETYKALVQVKPDELEARTLMGHCYKKKGDLDSAKEVFSAAVNIDPKYDYAMRSLLEVNNLLLAKEKPYEAQAQKQLVATKNLNSAINMIYSHADPAHIQGLKDVSIVFGETDSLAGYRNIAQWENHNKKIVVTNDYIWAAPEITASYIAHEAVHARDGDGISSIKEEQDAYQESIEFWAVHNNGIKDPELDYAGDLFKQNPKILSEKVAETYRSRDANMPEYSPNHTPKEGLGFLASLKLRVMSIRGKTSSQVILS